MHDKGFPCFPPRRDFASLSLRDLLDAREAYHVQFSAMRNVVATAVGRYWINEGDWFAGHSPGEDEPEGYQKPTSPRTLSNSVLRPWSWPCVLVFVRSWEPREDLGDQAIPRALYLPDGRIVPTCVILSEPDESMPPPAPLKGNASGLLGGGYQCLRSTQGVERVGTLACIVEREGEFYALTNKHVAGPAGNPVDSMIRGRSVRIGVSEATAIDKLPFSTVFPEWPGMHSIVDVDAGLVHIEDMSRWTGQVYGIGELDEVFDANANTVTLDLIGTPLRAFGGASGPLEGEIKALFFRYKSLGSQDYVSDILIGAAHADEAAKDGSYPPSASSQAGDSGTLWFFDPPNGDQLRGERSRRLKPVAMQWGGFRTLLPDGQACGFSLGAFFSTICGSLDVEPVRDWCLGYSEYWGKIAHFAIGWKACDIVDGALGQLMKANQARIGFDDATLGKGSAFSVGRGGFVPLADVPDYVWVQDKTRTHEGQQHFADIDIAPPEGRESILEAGLRDPAKVSPAYWLEQFGKFEALGCGPEEGTLPFRVWQIWDEMFRCLRDEEDPSSLAKFLVAAGSLAHYIGDASMPFHCSYLHHGRLPMMSRDGSSYPVPHSSPEYQAYSKTAEAKIHSIYDETILEVKTVDALSDIDALLQGGKLHLDIASGHGAAVETLKLMGAVRSECGPEYIIGADDPSLPPKARAIRLWSDEKIHRAALSSLARSVQLLARLWGSAWLCAGARTQALKARAFSEEEISAIYRDRKFLPAMTLRQMVDAGMQPR